MRSKNNIAVRMAACLAVASFVASAYSYTWTESDTHKDGTYRDPVGIPTAWIEPDAERPDRPADWSSEVDGYYYVSWQTGTDTGRPWGTPTAPRKTVPNPIPAGSYVELAPEAYDANAGGLCLFVFAGDSGPWVANTSGPGWLVGLDNNNRASITASLWVRGEYGCIEFIDNLSGNSGALIGSPTAIADRTANNILLRNSVFTGAGDSATTGCFSISGNSYAPTLPYSCEDIVFYNNVISNYGLDTPDGSDPDYVGVFVGDYCQNIFILDNEIHDMSGSAVGVTANNGSTIRTQKVFIGRNHFYDLWGTGIGVKTAQYVVASQNTVHDVEDNGGISPSKGLSAQYAASDVWFINNHVYSCAHGLLRVSGNGGAGETIYVIGNLIHDITALDGAFTDTGYGEAAIALWGSPARYVINNTMYNVPNGICSPAAQLEVIENNVIYDLNEANGEHIFYDLSGTEKDISINNNQFYEDGSAIKVQLPGESVMDVAALNASLYGDSNQSGDPLFEDAANEDFRLTSASPAVGNGLADRALSVNVYDLYYTQFGVGITDDRLGTHKPCGESWDIGATELWEPPLGIPHPEVTWGGTINPITDPAPDPATYCPSWPSAASATSSGGNAYYIDRFHPLATDTSNTFGYPDKPRLTFPGSPTFNPGDYVEIHGNGNVDGTYDGVFRPKGLGASTNPIWIVGKNRATIGNRLDFGVSPFAETGYIILDGINTFHGSAIDVRPRYLDNIMHDICFRNCDFRGKNIQAGTGISVGCSSPDTTVSLSTITQDIVFYNCEASSFGNPDDPAEECGVYPTLRVSRLWFMDGSVHDVVEDAFGGSHGGQWTSTGYYVGRSHIYNNITNAFDIKGFGANTADGGVTISENVMYGHWHQRRYYTEGTLYAGGNQYTFIGDSSDSDFSNLGAGAGPYTDGQSFTSTADAEPTSWGTATVARYLSSGQGETIGLHTGGETTSGPEYYNSHPAQCTVINNTIYDTRAAIWCSGIGDVRISGNVIYGTDSDGWINPISFTQVYDGISVSSSDGDILISHNTLHDCDGGIRVNATNVTYSPTAHYYLGSRVSYNNKHYSVINDSSFPATCSFDPATDVITFTAPHNISTTGDLAWIAFESTGDLPGGLQLFKAYEVDTIPSATTMTIRAETTNLPIDITDPGTGTITWRSLNGVVPTDTDHWKEIDTEIIGNVIADRPEPNYDIKISGFANAPDTLTIDYNLTYNSGGEIYHIEDSNDRNLVYIQANTPHQANGLNSDPLFVASGSLDFRPATGSPLRDAAVEGSVYSDYVADNPASFGTINYGRGLIERPDNSVWDIGALEFDSANPPDPPATAPSFSVPGGTYGSAQSVELTSLTTGAVIYYTTDGSTPDNTDTQYSAAVQVTTTTTVRAITYAAGYSQSPVASATYTITGPAPGASVTGGVTAGSVTISPQ